MCPFHGTGVCLLLDTLPDSRRYLPNCFLIIDWPTIYTSHYAAAAKSLQSCPTLWDPIDGSPPGSTVPGILQARTLEWVAISFSNAWKWKVKVKSLSCVRLFTTPWMAAHQPPPSMGFSRQEYWSGGAIAFSDFHLNVLLKNLEVLFASCHKC